MMAKQLVTALREELKEALKTFSPGGSISSSEWKKILSSLAEKMSNDEVDSLLKQADKSGRGNVKNDGENLRRRPELSEKQDAQIAFEFIVFC